MVNCHCRDCQRASGSAYAALLAFEQNSVKLAGELLVLRRDLGAGQPARAGLLSELRQSGDNQAGGAAEPAVCAGGQPGRSFIAQADGSDLGPERAALGPPRSAHSALRHAPAAVGGHGQRSGTAQICFRSISVSRPSDSGLTGLLSAQDRSEIPWVSQCSAK